MELAKDGVIKPTHVTIDPLRRKLIKGVIWKCIVDVMNSTNRWLKCTLRAKSESKSMGFLDRSLLPLRLSTSVSRVPVDLIM
jgi:hypothetical protein